MRILFVSGTSVGGAARSTYELGDVLVQRGHSVVTLMTDDSQTRTISRHKTLLNASAKLDRAQVKSAKALIERIRIRIGHDRSPVAGHNFPAWLCALPENAIQALTDEFNPDVVVVNSVERTAWRQIVAFCRSRGIPTVLYIREASGVRHLVNPATPADLILANAEAHAVEVRTAGFECEMVPSVVETHRCLIDSDRTRIILINPIALYGVDLAFEIAERVPTIPFTFIESWPLGRAEGERLIERCDALANVEFARYTPDPSFAYAQARFLLLLCTVPSRPRVVLEAQANGIPVLAVDRPGHRECVGPGGILVSPDAGPQEWIELLGSLWEDATRYASLCTAALNHASREEVSPTSIASRFEAALSGILRSSRLDHC